jgi:23S rRNA pseudouridine2605 synthase
VQLHRSLSKLGLGSRTQARDWIRQGRVRVDGQVVRDPLTWVDLDTQTITCDEGAPQRTEHVTLMLHKPAGVVTTARDERGRRTVYTLLPSDLPWIFPVGRLDAESEGLLLFTSDSALATHLTDPDHAVAKVYHVTLDGVPDEAALERLRTGIDLPDGRTRPCDVRRLAPRVLEFTLTEGRNRQLRRMAWQVGFRVERLVRVALGGLALGDLAAGAWRWLTPEEVAGLTGGERTA